MIDFNKCYLCQKVQIIDLVVPGRGVASNTFGQAVKANNEYSGVDAYLSNGECTVVYATQVCKKCSKKLLLSKNKEKYWKTLKNRLIRGIDQVSVGKSKNPDDRYGPKQLFEGGKINIIAVKDLTPELHQNNIV